MRLILLTNDDGVLSEGLRALAGPLAPLGELFVVAPIQEASAIGHALTLRHPLRIEPAGERTYTVDGTPTDCVNIAVATILPRRPDLVISGINKGANLGDDITYSGTAAGALEAALLGIPGIAVSLVRTTHEFDFAQAVAFTAGLAAEVLAKGLPPRTFLNVNVPERVPARGVKLTVQGRRKHVTSIVKGEDPRGQPIYWIDEGENSWEPHDDSDYQAVHEGWISVTPLQTDWTSRSSFAHLRQYSFDSNGGSD